jgi:methylated-DNA-[protein]-cysteine S-methyltransferase
MAKRRQKTIRYTIFRTRWGHFGICGTEYGLLRTALAGPAPEKVKAMLLKNLPDAKYEKRFFRTAQEQITAYFDGTCINFGKAVPIRLDGFSPFASRVLNACRDTGFGRTVTYGLLAEKAGWPGGAARAVGSVLAKNPLPLIIPCHRVVCANGKIGGFSAPGGIKLKRRLLKHEGVF